MKANYLLTTISKLKERFSAEFCYFYNFWNLENSSNKNFNNVHNNCCIKLDSIINNNDLNVKIEAKNFKIVMIGFLLTITMTINFKSSEHSRFHRYAEKNGNLLIFFITFEHINIEKL